jgi:hypothetical protein
MTQGVLWLVIIGCAAAVGAGLWHARRQWDQRRLAEEERAARMMAQVTFRPASAPQASAGPVPATPAAPMSVHLEKLLFDAAAKAGEAGEAALSIQLYARLIARYPQSAFLLQARAAVETQKKRLSIARAPGTSGPG